MCTDHWRINNVLNINELHLQIQVRIIRLI